MDLEDPDDRSILFNGDIRFCEMKWIQRWCPGVRHGQCRPGTNSVHDVLIMAPGLVRQGEMRHIGDKNGISILVPELVAIDATDVGGLFEKLERSVGRSR